MSTATTTGTAAAPTPTVARPAGRRRWVWPAAVGGLVVLTALLVALVAPRTRGGDLDPESAQPDGSRAVVQILRRQGVDVQVVRRKDDVVPGPRTTLVVVRPELAPVDLLRSLTERGGDLVLVEPDGVTLGLVDVPVVPAGDVAGRVAVPSCSAPDAVAAGAAAAGGRLYSADATATGGGGGAVVGCYPDDKDASATSFVTTSVTRGGSRTTVSVIGRADILRNGWLSQQGNAALALRTLGHRSVLQWYVPDPAELTADEAPTLSGLVPGWLKWATFQTVLAVLVALLWRARRLGRLVTEPLPVVVRAAEAQEGRARLYRQSGGRDRAAATLRTAALRRMARRFDVHPDADPAVVADLVARATGRDPAAVRAVLLGGAPGNDAALVRLADEIDVIEQDVSS